MRIIGNLLWWLFGGLEAAIGYFTGSLALACTIIGIPFANADIQDWSALPMAFWFYSKRIE